jgi:hypothetical protein
MTLPRLLSSSDHPSSPCLPPLSQVYEALYEAALREPLNASAVSEGYSRYLKHVINRPSRPAWGARPKPDRGSREEGARARDRHGLAIHRNVSRL